MTDLGTILCIAVDLLVTLGCWSVADERLAGAAGSRLLLALLYTHLRQLHLRTALELVDFLLRQRDVRKAVAMSQQDDVTRQSLLSLLQQVSQLPVRILYRAVSITYRYARYITGMSDNISGMPNKISDSRISYPA